MNLRMMKGGFGLLAVGAAAVASAEFYEARIYGIPVGYDSMTVTGTANTGDLNRLLMAGSVIPTGQSEPQAGYLTHTGFRNMNPAGWSTSRISDAWNNTYYVGEGAPTGTHPYRALFWIGSGPAINLHPAGVEYTHSAAFGGGGQIQVGYVEGTFSCVDCGFNPGRHAVAWNRTAASMKRLHSTTHDVTRAIGTNGTQIVGEGFDRNSGEMHALYWPSTNSSAINLNPLGYNESSATFTVGNLQGGYVRGAPTGSWKHAAIWTGSNNSMTDWNPAPFEESWLTGMQIGFFIGNGRPLTTPSRTQAFAFWGHNRTQWINLHAMLPYPYVLWNSFATDINAWGDVVGYIEKNGVKRPVIWIRH